MRNIPNLLEEQHIMEDRVIITIQPGNTLDGTYDPLKSLPKPFHVDAATGEIGRQEFWQGDPFSVIGFQKDVDVQTIDLYWDAAAADPDQIVGMFPVLIDTSKGEGIPYTFTLPITRVTSTTTRA
jgi:hypothetical protein